MTPLRRDQVVHRSTRRATTLLRLLRAVAVVVVTSGATVIAAAPASAASGLAPAQVRAQEWWTVSLNLQRAWRISKGAGVTVALLDSGVDAGFGDLRGAVRAGFVPGGSGDGRRDTDPAIHGTRLADEIAGRGTGFGLMGIAPRARILPVVIPDHAFVQPTVSALNRLAAMHHPPAVANMSYGSAAPCPPALQAAVVRAVDAGIILVASAGNSGSSTNIGEFPADCTGVVAVGAVDVHGRPWSDTQRQPYVSLAAPGVHMISADPQTASGYGYATGTSDAAAIVSGTLALVRAQFPQLSARDVVARVLATTHQFVGAQGSRNRRLGFGVALPYNALTERVPGDAPNPVYAEIRDASGDGAGRTRSSAPAPPSPRPVPPSGHTAGSAASSSSGPGAAALIGGLVVAVVAVAMVLVLLLRRRGAQR